MSKPPPPWWPYVVFVMNLIKMWPHNIIWIDGSGNAGTMRLHFKLNTVADNEDFP